MIHIGEYTGKKERELIQPGYYELVIDTVEWDVTSKTRETYIKMAFQIRRDVDQAHKGRMVFKNIYKSKETGEFPTDEISQIIDTTIVPGKEKETKRDFETYDDLMQHLVGINVRAEVVIKPADENYEGSKDKNIIKYFSFEKPKVNNEDDLPF
jgi:hypothetical protein